jgi:hypothetical protein
VATPIQNDPLLMSRETFLAAGGSSVERPTKTIAFNATGATILFWKADLDYDIVFVQGLGQVLLNLVGATYAALTAAGVHLDWIGIGSTSTSSTNDLPLRIRLEKDKILYSSHGAGNSFSQVILQTIS